MLEKNKDTLKRAIQALPQYEPDAFLWDAIEDGLEKAEAEVALHAAIRKLPSHCPPDLVWENIAATLEEEIKPVARIRSLPWLRKAAAAAVMVGFMTASFWLLNRTEKAVITYSEEIVEGGFVQLDWEEDEDAFLMIKELCKTQALVCKMPAFEELNTELEALERLREQLKPVLNEYETDAELLLQWGKLERERSDILKQLIAMI